MTTETLSGIILAGGRGRRLGGEDKGLLRWQNASLASHVANAMRPLVNELIISCNRHHQDYAALADVTCQDQLPDFAGPLAGLESALRQVRTPYALLCPCDMPLLSTALLEHLMQAADGQADINYLTSDGNAHYLCALIKTDSHEALTSYLERGGRSVRGWYAERVCRAIDASAWCAQLENINSSADLAALSCRDPTFPRP